MLAFRFERMGSQHVKISASPSCSMGVKVDGLRNLASSRLARWRDLAGPAPAVRAILAGTVAAAAARGLPAGLQQSLLISDERPCLPCSRSTILVRREVWTVGLAEDIISDLSHARNLLWSRAPLPRQGHGSRSAKVPQGAGHETLPAGQRQSRVRSDHLLPPVSSGRGRGGEECTERTMRKWCKLRV